MSNKRNVAVIGLGSMGFGMATSLLRAGHRTWGFDVAPAQVARFRAEGGQPDALSEAAEQLDIVVVVVLNAAQTEAVLFGPDGIASGLRPRRGGRLLRHGRAGFRPRDGGALRRDRRALSRRADLGGAAKAAQGRLSVMASGSASAFGAARQALDAMAETVFELGDAAGAGSAMKAVNQLLAGVHIAAMAEALTFGMTQGVEPAKFVEVISQCAGTSWMLENRAPHVVAGDYAPQSAVDIWPKDLGIVLDIARSAKFGAPLTAAALAAVPRGLRLGARARGRCGGGQGLCPQCRAEAARRSVREG